ncbi:putative LPS assembly protein LptD [Hymenobacter guriensis]|uniref:LPS-assembly protein LptD n=1 Tax=Hymenobacter guriensis TaxID=2793065 RepID=A0ABS0KXS2_9BACT|nr:putative LPS assembly protein LptD [Hymenobacter guriensis]MBG8552672.1 LPS-assembly protein LptD [Hymenobacter guriensis]
MYSVPGKVPRLALILGLWLGLSGMALAQQRPLPKAVPQARPRLAVDTTRTRSADSLRVAAAPQGDIKTTIRYSATDSIRFDVAGRVAYLYDKAKIDYDDLSLKAARIAIDYNKNILTAEGAPDTTGRIRDKPVFRNGAETYQSGRIAYNFKTRKGKIAEAVTQQGEGYVHAETIKRQANGDIYGRNGRYTTCNLENPHFYINATKMKAVPGEQVVSGPFNMVIGDIPTPLGFLFGYFPTPSSKKRASGLIFPSFGQTTDRGFFLRNGGYYWAASEYVGVRLTGEIYSGAGNDFGGWGSQADIQYRRRYRFNGSFNVAFSQRPANQILPEEDVTLDQPYQKPKSPRTFWVSWSHSPQTRPGGGQFSASVNLGSQDYNRLNSFDTRRVLTSSFTSSIRYSKAIRNSPINYAINLDQSQNTGTGEMNLTLPNFTVGVARQYPYEWLGLEPRGRFYEQFSIGYTLNGQNRLSNLQPARQLDGIPLIGGTSEARRIPISFNNLGDLFKNTQSGLQNQFQISLGSYTLLKHLNFSPSVSYSSSMYSKRLNYQYIQEVQALRIDTVRGFNYAHTYQGSASLSTNFYGLFSIKGKRVEAIRHKVSPSVSYSYTPDLRSSRWLYEPVRFENLTNANGELLGNRYLPLYNGFPYELSGSGQASLINFGLNNQVEMKVRTKEDTTGTTPFKKVSLIDNLSLNASYNLAREAKFRLSNISAAFNTQVAGGLTVNVNSSFSAYQRDSANRPIEAFLWEQKKWRIARLEDAGLSLTYQFNKQQRKTNEVNKTPPPNNNPSLGAPTPVNPYEDYVDFSIPWSLNASFTANYSSRLPVLPRAGESRTSPFTTVSLTLGGEIKITEKLRVGYTTGYDFSHKEVTYTSLDFYRDLHCWAISGNWIPFGQRQGYNFTIAAKSSLLQDLKLTRNRSFYNR